MKNFYVYIMASYRKTLYVGVTSDLLKRVSQHKLKTFPTSFTAKYRVTRLVYYEVFRNPREAIAREKQIKGWRRSKKIYLIEGENPNWNDLSLDWK